MKKLLSVLSILLFAATLSAQTVKPFKVSGFNAIDASGVYNIEVEKSSSEYLNIETQFELMKYVQVRVKDGVLVLSLNTDDMPRSLKRNTPEIKAKIGMKSLNKIKLSGATRILVKSKFTSSDFKVYMSGASAADIPQLEASKLSLDLSGASKLKFSASGDFVGIDVSGASSLVANLSYSELNSEISGASSANISGSVKTATVASSGASSVKAETLNSDLVKASASGASKLIVGRVNELEVKASGASSVRFYGKPVVKMWEVSGASSIKQMD